MGSVALEGFGNGAGVNFKVVPGLTQPGTATENTIWVMTESMTGWVIDSNQPESPEEGLVWIFQDTISTVAFNALKKNGIQIYPMFAKQYIAGVWVDIGAMSYRNGEWVEWWDGTLFDNGNQYAAITGGWTTDGYVYKNGEVKNTAAVIGDTIDCTVNKSASTCAIAGTDDVVDLSRFTTIKCTATAASTGFLMVHTQKSYSSIDDPVARLSLKVGENLLDVSALNDSYYIIIHVHGVGDAKRTAVVTNIKLE